MKALHKLYGKKLLSLSILLLLTLSLLSTLNVNTIKVSAVESPYIAVVPQNTTDLTLGTNFTVSIYTNYGAALDYSEYDATGYQFSLSWDSNVLNLTEVSNGDVIVGGDESFIVGVIDNTVGALSLTVGYYGSAGQVTSMYTPFPWDGDLANVTFTVVGYGTSNITLGYLTKLYGWNFVEGHEYKIIAAEFINNDTWTGDGVTTVFYTTEKPIAPDFPEQVYVNETQMTKPANYTIDYDTGEITFTAAPGSGEEIEATYHYINYDHIQHGFFANGGSIAGTVTDASTGEAIAGANVTANGMSTTTDSSGAYVIPNLPPGTYTVTASAVGYYSSSTSATVVTGETTTGIDFTLTPIPGAIAGRVTDVSTGDPIEGATVGADGYSNTTDVDGYYLIADVPPGNYNVTASAVGYYSDSKPATVEFEKTTTVNFALTPIVGWINGTVTDNATPPEPIEGATVTAGDYSATTDAEGHYNITDVPVGTYNVTASMSGYYDGVKTDISVTENATTTVNFALQLIVGWIEGYVTDNATIPIANATVTADTVASDTTNNTGYYKIEIVPGTYNLTASMPGYRDNVTYGVSVKAGETMPINFTLEPILEFGWINGTVTDANTGYAIVGAKVTADTIASGFTNETGHYSILVPAPETYNVTASAIGYYPSPLVTDKFVDINTTQIVDFELQLIVGWINGTVTDALTGEAIYNATVTADSYIATTNMTGEYTIPVDLLPGTYTVTASKPSYYSNSTSATVNGGITTTVDFELTPIPGAIDGTVTDASTGSPIAGATVKAVGPETKYTDTGADGYYLIADVPPGNYTVEVLAYGYYGDSKPATVESEKTTSVDFALAPIVGWINGTVTDAKTGEPIHNATVAADGVSDLTDAYGHYKIDVRPRDYTVNASKTGYYSNSTSVTVFAEETTTVDFELTPLPGAIDGTVTDASTGSPIAGATVKAVGPETKYTDTGADGYYLIADVPPGNYTVEVLAYGYYGDSKPATVEPEKTTTLDFALQRKVGWITGTVTDALTGDPIYNATVTANGYSTTTDIDGEYTIPDDLLPGNYMVEASKPGYISNSTSVWVSGGLSKSVDFELTPLPGAIDGTVTDASTGSPIAGATVTADGYSATTKPNGEYTLLDVVPGDYTVTVSASGYVNKTKTATVTTGDTTIVNFALAAPGVIAEEITEPELVNATNPFIVNATEEAATSLIISEISDPITIVVQNVTEPVGVDPPPGTWEVLGTYVQVTVNNTDITVNATIRIYYTLEQLEASGLDESTLEIHFWNATSGEWEPVESHVNTEEHYVWAIIDHFSLFAILGQPSEGEAPLITQLWFLAIVGVVIIAVIVLLAIYIRRRKTAVKRP